METRTVEEIAAGVRQKAKEVLGDFSRQLDGIIDARQQCDLIEALEHDIKHPPPGSDPYELRAALQLARRSLDEYVRVNRSRMKTIKGDRNV